MQARRHALPLVLALASFLPLSFGSAEAQPQAEFEEAVEVEEVALDVLVTDRKGNVVVGLDADDFLVREDGEPVEITDITFYSNRRFLESVARETNGYYLITYRSPHPRGERGYQEVTVDTENPRLRVKVREGYRYGEE